MKEFTFINYIGKKLIINITHYQEALMKYLAKEHCTWLIFAFGSILFTNVSFAICADTNTKCPYYNRHPDTHALLPSNLKQPKTLDEAWSKEKDVLILYQMLKDIHELFVSHKLAYWIDSGTLLGAIRHQGLIPWDDDLDICIHENNEFELIKLADELEVLGYGFVPTLFGYKIYPLNGQAVNKCPWKFPSLDVFIMTIKDDKLLYQRPWAQKAWKVELDKNIVYPIKSYRFGSFYVMGPNKGKEYLNNLYGKEWTLKGLKDYDCSQEVHIQRLEKNLDSKDFVPAQPLGPLIDKKIHPFDHAKKPQN